MQNSAHSDRDAKRLSADLAQIDAAFVEQLRHRHLAAETIKTYRGILVQLARSFNRCGRSLSTLRHEEIPRLIRRHWRQPALAPRAALNIWLKLHAVPMHVVRAATWCGNLVTASCAGTESECKTYGPAREGSGAKGSSPKAPLITSPPSASSCVSFICEADVRQHWRWPFRRYQIADDQLGTMCSVTNNGAGSSGRSILSRAMDAATIRWHCA